MHPSIRRTAKYYAVNYINVHIPCLVGHSFFTVRVGLHQLVGRRHHFPSVTSGSCRGSCRSPGHSFPEFFHKWSDVSLAERKGTGFLYRSKDSIARGRFLGHSNQVLNCSFVRKAYNSHKVIRNPGFQRMSHLGSVNARSVDLSIFRHTVFAVDPFQFPNAQELGNVRFVTFLQAASFSTFAMYSVPRGMARRKSIGTSNSNSTFWYTLLLWSSLCIPNFLVHGPKCS